jgi:hypothetical protein
VFRLRHPATGIWLLLVLATGLSWWFGTDHGAHADQHRLRTTISLMLIAFIKVRFVIMYFMEVRTAPLVVRLLGETWVLGVCAAILCIYVAN